jgi:hypothetical protein
LHEQARPALIRESRRAPWLPVSVVCFGAFMGQLDASIVTITFPDLVLPGNWGDRRRSLAGALLACAAMAAATVIPLTPATVVPQLALAWHR